MRSIRFLSSVFLLGACFALGCGASDVPQQTAKMEIKKGEAMDVHGSKNKNKPPMPELPKITSGDDTKK